MENFGRYFWPLKEIQGTGNNHETSREPRIKIKGEPSGPWEGGKWGLGEGPLHVCEQRKNRNISGVTEKTGPTGWRQGTAKVGGGNKEEQPAAAHGFRYWESPQMSDGLSKRVLKGDRERSVRKGRRRGEKGAKETGHNDRKYRSTNLFGRGEEGDRATRRGKVKGLFTTRDVLRSDGQND